VVAVTAVAAAGGKNAAVGSTAHKRGVSDLKGAFTRQR